MSNAKIRVVLLSPEDVILDSFMVYDTSGERNERDVAQEVRESIELDVYFETWDVKDV